MPRAKLVPPVSRWPESKLPPSAALGGALERRGRAGRMRDGTHRPLTPYELGLRRAFSRSEMAAPLCFLLISAFLMRQLSQWPPLAGKPTNCSIAVRIVERSFMLGYRSPHTSSISCTMSMRKPLSSPVRIALW